MANKINIEQIEEHLKQAGLDNGELENLLNPIKELNNQRRYGLVWEEPDNSTYGTDSAEQELLRYFPFLKEVNEHRIFNGEEHPDHLLIEGDNLHALKTLQYTHKNKIDVIYIDPPYNTGNTDFVYNDKFVDGEDSWRHSKWLSFMNKRLRLARELMTDEGVIFISIDDNEQAQLKLLCDQIFGEDNFISLITVETASNVYGLKASSIDKKIIKTSEYLMAYRKKKGKEKVYTPLRTSKKNIFDTHYNIYVSGRERKTLSEKINEDLILLEKLGVNKVSISELNKHFGVNKGAYTYFIKEYANKTFRAATYSGRVNDTDKLKELNDGNVVEYGGITLVKNSNNKIDYLIPLINSIHYTDDYVSILGDSAFRGNIWSYSEDFKNVSNEGHTDFKNGKKPLRLIKDILKWYNKKDATVLDFFAGSGTTAHAVMELNKEDGGNRQAIVITNNEINTSSEETLLVEKGYVEPFTGSRRGTKKHAEWLELVTEFKKTEEYKDFIQTDEYKDLGIARAVTEQRINKVINGYTTPKGKEVEGLSNNNFYHFEVVLEPDLLDMDLNTYVLVNKTKDIIRIKEGVYTKEEDISTETVPSVKLTGKDKEVIVVLSVRVTDADIEELVNNFKYSEKEHVIYTSYTGFEYEINNIRFEELPKELLQAIKHEEGK